MYEKYRELEAEFQKLYSDAQKAREKNDYYNLVIALRKAGQCQMDMLDVCPPDQRGPIMTRAKEFLNRAKAFEELHPECFGNTNQSGGASDELKLDVVSKTNTTFDDIVGCEDVKNFVRMQYIKRFSDKYRVVFSDGRGGNLERGILLFGLPGTGKTMLARAICSEVNGTFISVKASELKNRFYGESEKKIRALYEEASKYPLTILFIDEIETLLPSRSGDLQNHEAATVTEFLTVMDGFEKEKMSNVITIAATNYPNKIDPAGLRTGRLSRWFRIDPPDRALREKLISRQFADGYVIENAALQTAAKGSKGFSSSDVVALCDCIKTVLSEAGVEAVDRGEDAEKVVHISSYVTCSAVDKALKTSNSSISEQSVREIALFEQNYNYVSPNGPIKTYMEKLD